MQNRFKYRTQYDVAQDILVRHATTIVCTDESLTIQDAPGSDINETLRQFGITDGSILPGRLGTVEDPRFYGDFTDVPDLRTAMDRLRAAEQAFAALPADLRAEFHNDPLALHEWVSDPGNAEAAVEIGLLSKLPTPKPAPVAPPQSTANPPGGSAGT